MDRRSDVWSAGSDAGESSDRMRPHSDLYSLTTALAEPRSVSPPCQTNSIAQTQRTCVLSSYPDSKWDNIRDNMGTGSTAPPSPTTSTSTVASPTIVVMTTSTTTTQATKTTSTAPTIVVMTTSTTTTQATKTTSTSAPAPTPTSPYSCMCADVAQWNTTVRSALPLQLADSPFDVSMPPQAVYVGGNEAVYGKRVSAFCPLIFSNSNFSADHLWTAKWWTENDVPGGAGKSLADLLP